MARYLLSSQVILDIAKRQQLPAEVWLLDAAAKGDDATDICMSAVTPMLADRAISDAIDDAKQTRDGSKRLPKLYTLQENLHKLVEDFAQDDRIVAMDHRIANRWSTLLDSTIVATNVDTGKRALGSAEKVEIATAIEGRDGIKFIYVTAEELPYEEIPGLMTEVP